MRHWACAIVMGLLVSSGVYAAIDVYEFPNQDAEARFRELTHELRCPKCQNQNVNDSSAPLARDIKDRVHQLVLEGRSKDEITEYMIERYGDFVTYRPRASLGIILLWVVPATVGVFALAVLFFRRRPAVPAALSDAERQRLQALLDATRASEETSR